MTDTHRPSTPHRVPSSAHPSSRPSFRVDRAAGSPRHPGTISLGQGIVSYRPAAEAARRPRARFGADAGRSPYGPVEGLPALVEALEPSSRAENGIRVRPDSRVVVTAGGNLAFMNAILAITDPGRRSDPAGAVLLQPRDGDRDGRRAARAGADHGRPSARRRRHRARDHAAHARDRHRLAEQPDRRRLPGSVAARGQRALPRSRHLSHARRGLRVLHVRRRAPFLAGVDRRRRGAHASRSIRCRRRTAWRAGGWATW